jgi:hypothetical protein
VQSYLSNTISCFSSFLPLLHSLKKRKNQNNYNKQYGGVHWSKNKELFYKHLDEYKKCTATIFKECNLFVIWGMIVAKDYDGLTEHFVQLDDDKTKHLSKSELSNLLKERLQCTTWSY